MSETRSLVHRAAGPSAEAVTSFQSLSPGVYWRALRALSDGAGLEIEAGALLLLLAVPEAYGEAHTVELRPHPLERRVAPESYRHRLLVADFLAAFEPAHDGEAHRRAEMAEVSRRAEALQQELLAHQRNPSRLLGEITGEGGEPLDPSVGLPPAGAEQMALATLSAESAPQLLVTLQRQATNQHALAAAQANWIAEQTARISATLAQMAPFYAEQAAAALACCQAAVARSQNILAGVRTLGLFVGEGVEVQTLCQGEAATPDSPLTLFQRRLYLDEEMLIHVAEGGAGFEHLEELKAALADTEGGLLQRLIPAERGVVALCWRRHAKRYSDDPLVDAFHNAANRATFLLVRSGQNAYLVDSELGTHAARRLFPTCDEMERPFAGLDGERITLQDVRFTDALKAHDDAALFYRRLLILLWGLQERLGLFGKLPAGLGPSANFLDASFQGRFFRFVADDESNLLGDGRPSWRKFVAQKNAYLQSGSRLLCVWKTLLTPRTCPSVAEWGRSADTYHLRCQPVAPFSVEVVRRQGSALVVGCEVAGATTSLRAKNTKRSFAATVFFQHYDDWGELAYLCLDAVTPEELDAYLNDRSCRQDYLEHAQVLVAARDALRAEAALQAPLYASLAAALAEGGLGQGHEEVIARALRTWRAAHRGAIFPSPTEPGYRGAWQGLLNQIFALLQASTRYSTPVEALCAARGVTPLRLVSTGAGKLVLYATTPEADRDPALTPWPFVERWRLVARRSGAMGIEGGTRVALPACAAKESMLHQWPDAGTWSERRSPGGMSFEALQRLLGHLESGEAAAGLWLEGASRLGEALDALSRQVRAASKRHVRLPRIRTAVALVRLEAAASDYALLTLAFEALPALWWSTMPAERGPIEAWIRDQYQKPEAGLAHAAAGLSPRWELCPISALSAEGTLGEEVFACTSEMLEPLCPAAVDRAAGHLRLAGEARGVLVSGQAAVARLGGRVEELLDAAAVMRGAA